ncbi:MAG TPA: TonB family protein [Steroidobacteraceae bacterium]
MRNWLIVTLVFAILGGRADITAAQTQPVPDDPLHAQTLLRFDPKTRCPDLRIADEGTMAVVIFWLPRTGIPSHVSLKSSSGSSALDSAALDCVSRLRFAPATRLGDGELLDSWQQFALRWANLGNDESRAITPLPKASQAAEPVAEAAAQIAGDGRQMDSGGQTNSVTVHVCVDESGKLKQDPTIVHSSGKASIDQAAVRIAAAGSAYYRLDPSLKGPPVSGCAQLAIRFETK